MSSKFLQGDGYPILKRYNSSNALQETIVMPYVRDDGNKSYVRQYFDPYPDETMLHQDLLSGNINEDKVMGYKFRCEIKYSSITADNLKSIYNCIGICRRSSGNYLLLSPRNDNDGTYTAYKIVLDGGFELISTNMWQHNVILKFKGIVLVSKNLAFEIPPVEPV